MLNNDVVKAMGFDSFDAFYKLVKSKKNLKSRERLTNILNKYLESRKGMNHEEIVKKYKIPTQPPYGTPGFWNWQEKWGHYFEEEDSYGYGEMLEQAVSCCGVGEIADCEGNPEDLHTYTIQAMIRGFNAVVYYSVDKKTLAEAHKLGYQTVTEFTNDNTGRRITALLLNVLE